MILKAENLTFAYKGGNNVFEDVSLTVENGDVLAILGPNGAGKTTLLKSILGILPVKSGSVTLDNVDVRKIPEKGLFKRISYVPQAKNTTASYSVLDTVLIGLAAELSVFKAPGEKEIARAKEVLDELNIGHLIDKRCNRISGGELQMVLIARALISDPEILILDEPESNLDFKNQLIVLDTLTRLSKRGIACIFNTHYPSHALQRANKAAILSNHHVLFGETEKTVTEERIEEAFGVKAVVDELEFEDKKIKSVIPIELINR